METFPIVSLGLDKCNVSAVTDVEVPDIVEKTDTTMFKVLNKYTQQENMDTESACISVEDDPDINVFEVNSEATNVVFHENMKLVEFLRANPQIRTKKELLQYYDEEVIMRAIHVGAIMYMQGKIVL